MVGGSGFWQHYQCQYQSNGRWVTIDSFYPWFQWLFPVVGTGGYDYPDPNNPDSYPETHNPPERDIYYL